MGRIFITGSADGLGLLAAKALINLGHQVVLHARNEARAALTLSHAPGAAAILVGDLSDINQTKRLALEANALGVFDAVIHNAGIYRSKGKTDTDGLPELLKVNTLAPYILTAMMDTPKRLIYLSSGMHLQGNARALNYLERVSYSDTKLHCLILAKAVARLFPGIYSNAVDPGWVPTKMGGNGAPDNLEEGYHTQVWLAGGDDAGALVSGNYFHHKKHSRYHKSADDITVQEAFLQKCLEMTGVQLNENTK